MTTARDIIAGAYRRLGLLPLGADLDPAGRRRASPPTTIC